MEFEYALAAFSKGENCQFIGLTNMLQEVWFESASKRKNPTLSLFQKQPIRKLRA